MEPQARSTLNYAGHRRGNVAPGLEPGICPSTRKRDPRGPAASRRELRQKKRAVPYPGHLAVATILGRRRGHYKLGWALFAAAPLPHRTAGIAKILGYILARLRRLAAFLIFLALLILAFSASSTSAASVSWPVTALIEPANRVN